eukprot:tig00000470_g1174.t1
MAPSVANSSVTGLVVSRDSFSFSCSAPSPIGWLGGVGGTATCVDEDADPATTYTYTAHYIGQEGLTSERAHFNVTTPPEAPLVVKGPYRATTSTLSVEIELPVGWENEQRTELYRDGAGSSPIVTIPLSRRAAGRAFAMHLSADAVSDSTTPACRVPRVQLHARLLTVRQLAGCASRRGVGAEGALDPLPAPVPVTHANTNYPSVTVNVSLPRGSRASS